MLPKTGSLSMLRASPGSDRCRSRSHANRLPPTRQVARDGPGERQGLRRESSERHVRDDSSHHDDDREYGDRDQEVTGESEADDQYGNRIPVPVSAWAPERRSLHRHTSKVVMLPVAVLQRHGGLEGGASGPRRGQRCRKTSSGYDSARRRHFGPQPLWSQGRRLLRRHSRCPCSSPAGFDQLSSVPGVAMGNRTRWSNEATRRV